MGYSLAGLHIVSDVPLSDLVPHHEAVPPGDRVTIRRAPVSPTLSAAVATLPDAAYDGKDLLLTIPHVARYLVRAGNEILVDPEPAADANDVRAYLLGSAFGALCHQRGIVPLHASAIDSDGGCALFTGHSGAGKSTLAAALIARGHQLIADDVSFLRLGTDAQVMVWPGIGRIRLWEDAVAAVGGNGRRLERELRGQNKYLLPIPPPRNPRAPRRLRRVYGLGSVPAGSAAGIVEVRGASAVELLMQNVYRSAMAACMGRTLDSFAVCTAIARHVPVFEFRRPRQLEALRVGIDCLEDHLRNA